MVILHENAFKSWNSVLKFQEQITKMTNITMYKCTYIRYIYDWVIDWFALYGLLSLPAHFGQVSTHTGWSQGHRVNQETTVFRFSLTQPLPQSILRIKWQQKMWHCTKSNCTHYDNNQKPNLVEKALNFLPFHSECVCSMNMYVQLPYWWLSLEYTASSVLMK